MTEFLEKITYWSNSDLANPLSDFTRLYSGWTSIEAVIILNRAEKMESERLVIGSNVLRWHGRYSCDTQL